jgi:hypothetical protein
VSILSGSGPNLVLKCKLQKHGYYGYFVFARVGPAIRLGKTLALANMVKTNVTAPVITAPELELECELGRVLEWSLEREL